MTPDLASAISGATLDEVRRPGAYDAVVVGAGAAGGLAAALLTEAGLRVLVLDAGWRPPFWRAPARRTLSSVLAALAHPRTLKVVPHGLLWKAERVTRILGRVRQPVQTQCYAWPSAPESFVDDKACPYETPPDQPFQWIRARGLGGRMVVPLHGRQYLRHTARDFQPSDGLSPPWPFAPEELDGWYDVVEDRLDLIGRRDHNPLVADSRITHEREPTPLEAGFIAKVEARNPGYRPVLGRYAQPMDGLSSAAATGRLLCRQGAIARHVEVDAGGRVTGVVFHDVRDGGLETARAPLVFLCASSLESTRVLLASRDDRHPEGLGGRSGVLGRYLMDHINLSVEGFGRNDTGYRKKSELGQCVFLPRYDARGTPEGPAQRGFGVRVYLTPDMPGAFHFVGVADGEMLPNRESRVTLSERRDAWGIPTLRIACKRSEPENAMAKAQAEALREIAELAGVQLKAPVAPPLPPGATIHECGTARMGADPAASVLDPHNECWDAKGLYVTDGACFPSQGAQNPTLTIMALTARACNHAVRSVRA